AQVKRVVGVADLVPVLPSGDRVGAGRQHLVDRIEASAEQAGLRSVAVEWDAEREHLAAANETGGGDDILGTHVVERADLVVLAPAPPILELLRGLRDRLPTHFNVHCCSSVAHVSEFLHATQNLNSTPGVAIMIAGVNADGSADCSQPR